MKLTIVECFQRPVIQAVSWMPPATPVSHAPMASFSQTVGRTVVSLALLATLLWSRAPQVLHSAWVSVCSLVPLVWRHESGMQQWGRAELGIVENLYGGICLQHACACTHAYTYSYTCTQTHTHTHTHTCMQTHTYAHSARCLYFLWRLGVHKLQNFAGVTYMKIKRASL